MTLSSNNYLYITLSISFILIGVVTASTLWSLIELRSEQREHAFVQVINMRPKNTRVMDTIFNSYKCPSHFTNTQCQESEDFQLYLQSTFDPESSIRTRLMPGFSPGSLATLESDEIGMYGGYFMISTHQYKDDSQVKGAFDKLHMSAHPQLKTYYGIDGEGGVVQRLPSTYIPKPTSDLSLTCLQASNLGNTLESLGVNINFAPVVDVPTDPGHWISTRSLSYDYDATASISESYVSCLQRGNVGATVKHFPGHGRTAADSHKQVPSIDISKEAWLESDAEPFQRSIDAGVEAVMVGHLTYPQVDTKPASLSYTWISEILKVEMGFDGLVIIDDINMLQPRSIEQCSMYVRQAIEAGGDIVLVVHSKICDVTRLPDVIARSYIENAR